MLLMCRGPWWPSLVSGTDSPHQEDCRDAGQRADADGARRRAVVARILGHRVNLERALVVLVADERRDDDLPRLALGSIVLGNVRVTLEWPQCMVASSLNPFIARGRHARA